MNPEICIIAALAEKSRVIGKDGKIPWRISADFRRFRELTTPHPIIMGRKTFESIGRPLPGRDNIIITRNPNYHAEGCDLAEELVDGILLGTMLDNDRLFIIGGGEIYKQGIGRADRLFLTLVEGDFEGDTFFPDYSAFTKKVSEQSGEENGLRYKFVELER